MKLFIGVDVSKRTLDVFCNNKIYHLSNNPGGLKKFYSLLQKVTKEGHEIALIICEATGGYEAKLIRFARLHNLPIKVAHANKVRNHAKSKGLLAKTDMIDSRLLAEYAQTMNVQPDSYVRSAEEEKLVGLIKRREQLKRDKVREMLRLDKEELGNEVKKSIKAHVKWLDKEIHDVEELIKKSQETEEINAKLKLLTSVPSIGDITAYTLIAFLPELGCTEDGKKMVALAGLAPYAKDSGKYKGKRFIQGGRSILRRSLYMSAITAIKHYKELREFYLRLRSKGKPGKVALIAVSRKLLTILNRVMYRCTPWIKTVSA